MKSIANSMRDLFGSNYHVWLDLVRQPEFGFLVVEYQQFLLRYWREPIAPQGHAFRLVGASSNVLSLAEAARKAKVTPVCVMEAYRAGEIEGHFAWRKSRRRILWIDTASFEVWHQPWQKALEQVMTCRAVEELTGFGKATLREFEHVGLIQSVAAPTFSKIRGLCFDRYSVSRLIQKVAIAANQSTCANDVPLIILGEAARLYLGRVGLAKFLVLVISIRLGQTRSLSTPNLRLFDLKFPLSMIWISRRAR